MASRHDHLVRYSDAEVVPQQGRSSGLYQASRGEVRRPKTAAARADSVTLALARLVRPEAASTFTQAARALIAACGSKKPNGVTATDVAEACAGWTHLKPSTRQGYHAGVRRCLEVMGVPPASWRGIPTIKTPDPRAVVAPDAEFENTLKAAPLALRFVMLCAREMALRSGTIYRLTPRDCVNGQIKVVTKNSKIICVPASPRVSLMIQTAKDAARYDDQLIVQILGAPRTTWMRSWMTRKLKDAQRSAGCPGAWVMHDLRRTAAHQLYRNSNGDLHRVKALLGHDSLGSTMVYLHAKQLPVTADDVSLVLPQPKESEVRA